MSVRPRQSSSGNANNTLAAQQLRQDIETARSVQAAELSFEQLTETEKSAATIGVSPDEWKPIGWINEAHYGELLKNNVLAGRLTQQATCDDPNDPPTIPQRSPNEPPTNPQRTPNPAPTLAPTLAPNPRHDPRQIEAYKVVAGQGN